ncbi:hypothetical protein SUGI_1024830 [Cryptomeria japonica]|nr:hypothetical protein SUGI_1024830 [Cryptomeria japonica]
MVVKLQGGGGGAFVCKVMAWGLQSGDNIVTVKHVMEALVPVAYLELEMVIEQAKADRWEQEGAYFIQGRLRLALVLVVWQTHIVGVDSTTHFPFWIARVLRSRRGNFDMEGVDSSKLRRCFRKIYIVGKVEALVF